MTISSSLPPFFRRFTIACVIVATLATIGIVAGDAYERNAFVHSRKVHLANGVLHRKPPGAPANYLLIGSDSRQANDTGSNADVIMVLHVEPATRNGFLVSFPRDLVVDIPGHGQRLLNAA
ncbi:MAG: polyisoprenyl-teichoic acid--peptidoglycan teichoic acid transferase, partial [Actinomycetota bacterium]|nr:polyisoprenyl-teichoic acid--peptidoglycan teichoic acid transferase [Actinomycetota bacterium]